MSFKSVCDEHYWLLPTVVIFGVFVGIVLVAVLIPTILGVCKASMVQKFAAGRGLQLTWWESVWTSPAEISYGYTVHHPAVEAQK